MKSDERCRLDLVPARSIKRMPGLRIGASPKGVEKAKNFTRERGHCLPVVLSESGGRMTLLSNAAAFEACIEESGGKIPAVIVKTQGDADDLLFALQSAALNDLPDAVAISAAIVRLVDAHGVPRKQIAKLLGKSPAWVNRAESLSRRLNGTVQMMVTQGEVPSRSAQEIARLPDEVQAAFAISAGDASLSKESVTYLVNRYLDGDVGDEERDRIINAPKLALPNGAKHRGRKGADRSDSARLSRAMARCLDDAAYLSRLLGRIDLDEAAVRIGDAVAVADALDALAGRMRTLFVPGKNTGGMMGGGTYD